MTGRNKSALHRLDVAPGMKEFAHIHRTTFNGRMELVNTLPLAKQN